jgi:hypothetical protein
MPAKIHMWEMHLMGPYEKYIKFEHISSHYDDQDPNPLDHVHTVDVHTEYVTKHCIASHIIDAFDVAI